MGRIKHNTNTEFLLETKPSEKSIFIIDANVQGIDTHAMKLLKAEFPETYKMLREALEEPVTSPYGLWLMNTERHYNFAVIFGLDKRHGSGKDKQDEVTYVVKDLIRAVVKKHGHDCDYHSLYLYNEQIRAKVVNQFINNLNVKWTFYKE